MMSHELEQHPKSKIQNPDSNKTLTPIILALIVAILPHIGRLPFWIVLWCAGMWGYQLLSPRFGRPGPGKFIRLTLTVTGIAGLLLTYAVRLGPDAFLGLLAIMAALKPFEINSHRDRMITVFMAYFMVITSLFLSETLAITLYMFVSVGITTAVLIRVNDPQGRFRKNLKLSTAIMAQAIPLMIFLFLLFPRVQGGFFGFTRMGGARSGFSDTLNPGDVSSLVENDAVAFRAEFDGPIPRPELRYWRGIVFENFDGRIWRAKKNIAQTTVFLSGQDPVSYTVTLEPYQGQWLFALEMPGEIPRSAVGYADYTLRARLPVASTLRYSLTSHTRYRTGTGNPPDPGRTTRLPDRGNPESRRLALQITQNAASVDEKVTRILKFFRSGGFVYTLTPPLLGQNPVDDFLFKSKKGYCEHYASAFAFMMRAAGVPARIVGGYQGGEVNPYGNFLVVRQNDAHVWVEVWHPEKGWVRTDPTSAVAPERITGGPEGLLGAEGLMRKYFGGLSGLFDEIRLRWEALNVRWRAWFETYSYEQQRALLAKIGITSGAWGESLRTLVILLLTLGSLIIGVVVFFVLKPPRQKPDAVRKYYALFCRKLDRAGLARRPDQGPLDYAAHVSKNRPDLGSRMHEITGLYVRLRYQGQPPKATLADFIKKIKEFKPVIK